MLVAIPQFPVLLGRITLSRQLCWLLYLAAEQCRYGSGGGGWAIPCAMHPCIQASTSLDKNDLRDCDIGNAFGNVSARCMRQGTVLEGGELIAFMEKYHRAPSWLI